MTSANPKFQMSLFRRCQIVGWSLYGLLACGIPTLLSGQTHRAETPGPNGRAVAGRSGYGHEREQGGRRKRQTAYGEPSGAY